MVVVAVAAVLLVLAGVFVIGRAIIRSHYYVAEYNGRVTIIRGIQGAALGIPLQQPYLVACLNNRNELSLVSYGQTGGHFNCQLMKPQDLHSSAQVQVQNGLPICPPGVTTPSPAPPITRSPGVLLGPAPQPGVDFRLIDLR